MRHRMNESKLEIYNAKRARRPARPAPAIWTVCKFAAPVGVDDATAPVPVDATALVPDVSSEATIPYVRTTIDQPGQVYIPEVAREFAALAKLLATDTGTETTSPARPVVR